MHPRSPFAAAVSLAALLGLASAAAATPITSPNANVTGSASDPAGADSFTLDAPPAALPLSADALVDDAAAFASVDSAFDLTTSTSVSGVADAQANATFDGTFTAPGSIGGELLVFVFTLDLERELTTDGSIDALAEFIVLLGSGLETLLDESFLLTPGSQRFERQFLLAPGASADLSLLLSSSTLGNDGNAFAESFSSAAFSVQSVAEPATLPLLGLGLLLLATRRGVRRPARR